MVSYVKETGEANYSQEVIAQIEQSVHCLLYTSRKSCNECKRISQPNCETDGSSSNESWS